MRLGATVVVLPLVSQCLCFTWNLKQQRLCTLVRKMCASLDDSADEEGMKLAEEFFQRMKEMKVLEDEEEDEEDEEEDCVEIPVSAVNVFKGIDEGRVGRLAGNVTFTNKELYKTLKERVLESPSAFVDLVSPPEEDEEGSVAPQDAEEGYRPPKTVPDPELTAGEVVTVVLEALNHNDTPDKNAGVKLLFGYSSPGSILRSPVKAPTIEEYADFLNTSEYKVLLHHHSVLIDKADYSYDKKKAFFTVRLKTGNGRKFTSVNFILSTKGSNEDDSWLIDSILIRPDGIGRRRGT